MGLLLCHCVFTFGRKVESPYVMTSDGLHRSRSSLSAWGSLTLLAEAMAKRETVLHELVQRRSVEGIVRRLLKCRQDNVQRP